MKKLFLLLFWCCCFSAAQAQWVVTVAGVLESPGFNDGEALSSRFFNPHGIAVDSSGIVYIADRYNHTVRRFDPFLEEVTTLAGVPGDPGDADGPALTSRFNEPWGICVTPDGVIYVADTKNNKIRKITQGGTVSTVAGTGNYGTTDGPAAVATFGNPTGIEITPEGVIYVADHNTHIIRKISSTGVVSTLAGFPYISGDSDGTGNQAQFWRPYGLTLDNEGNIIVADEWNHKIRKVTPQGEVTTIAGDGEVGLVNGAPETARFQYPWDVTVDEEGNIFVADGYNYVIRVIEAGGTVSSFAGTPGESGGVDGQGENASFSGATAVAWSKKESAIYVGDAYNHLVRTIYVDGLGSPSLSLNVESGSTHICEGETVSMEAFPGFFEYYNFYLNGQLLQDGINSSLSLPNLLPGEYEVIVEALFENDLLTTTPVTITVSEVPAPTISSVGPLSFYEGDSVILIAAGTGDFLWSNGSSEQTITVFESGTYFVEESIGGCTAMSESVVVEVTPLPDGVSILVEGDPFICPGDTARLVSSYQEGNQWLKDGWPIDGETERTLETTEAGFYQVQVEDPVTGITALSEGIEIMVVSNDLFDFNASPRQAYPNDEISFSLTGSETPLAIEWNFGDPNAQLGDNTSEDISPSHIYTEEGAYTVSLTAIDENGCEHFVEKEDHVRILAEGTVILDDTGGLFVPTAFTPNADGENDIFFVRGEVTGDFYMAVYNHWGEPLFISENQDLGWDGTRDGVPAQIATYTYVVLADTPNGKKQLAGHITLLR